MTWELKSRQSPCTYADLIGIVALRIIEIGDQSARFGFLHPLLPPPTLLRFPSLSFFCSVVAWYELAYRELEVIMYVFINYAILRVIMRPAKRRKSENNPEREDGARFVSSRSLSVGEKSLREQLE